MKTKADPLTKNTSNKTGKRNSILHWSLTALVALGFLMSSFMYLGQNPGLMENFKKAGFPVYFVTLLGLAKLLGALAILNPWLPKLKEWAYAGFTFTLIGATWTHIATNTPFVAPLVFLALLAASYFFYQRITTTETELKYSEVKA